MRKTKQYQRRERDAERRVATPPPLTNLVRLPPTPRCDEPKCHRDAA